MARLLKILLRLVVVLVLIDILDAACLYRDPGVNLAGGYTIGAISPGSPCWLEALPGHQCPAKLDHWNAEVELSELDPEHAAAQVAVWLPPAENPDAQPPEKPRLLWCPPGHLEGVTSFSADEKCVIGTYEAGYFLLHVSTGLLETWSSISQWSKAVARESSLSANELKNPKSRWLLTREPVVYAIYAGIFLAGLVWAMAPLYRRGDAQPEPPSTE